jgi:hypothetical protein
MLLGPGGLGPLRGQGASGTLAKNVATGHGDFKRFVTVFTTSDSWRAWTQLVVRAVREKPTFGSSFM